VHITQGPALESARDDWAIITWTSNNPGGSDEHFGVVRCGTDPKNLSQTATSHIGLNPGHSYTVFREQVDGLKPKTSYYYKVDSANANGASDKVPSHAPKNFISVSDWGYLQCSQQNTNSLHFSATSTLCFRHFMNAFAQKDPGKG